MSTLPAQQALQALEQLRAGRFPQLPAAPDALQAALQPGLRLRMLATGRTLFAQGAQGKTLGERVEYESARYWTQLLGKRNEVQLALSRLPGKRATFP